MWGAADTGQAVETERVINKIKYAKQDDGLMFGPSLEVDGPAEGVVDLVRGGCGGSESSQAGYLYIYFTTTDTTDTNTYTAEIINSDSVRTPPDSLCDSTPRLKIPPNPIC